MQQLARSVPIAPHVTAYAAQIACQLGAHVVKVKLPSAHLEQAAAKKPAPDIYRWVLDRLGLAGTDCLAIEDSGNGVRAALGAGIPVLVTASSWTQHDDFSGALVILPDLADVDLQRLGDWLGQVSAA